MAQDSLRSEQKKDSIIQMTFQAIALQYLGRTEEAKLLAKKTLKT